MPDLGNLSLPSSLTLPHCPNLKSPADPPDPGSFPYPGSVKTLGLDTNWQQRLCLPSSNEGNGGGGIRVFRRRRAAGEQRPKKAPNCNGLDDHVSAWVCKNMELGVPESRCLLPFLVGAKKMVPFTSSSFVFLHFCLFA